MRFNLTEHCVMRYKQRGEKKLDKDLYKLYLELKNKANNALLVYVSQNRDTLYYEVEGENDLYFVVSAKTMCCTTIKKLSQKEKINLDYA